MSNEMKMRMPPAPASGEALSKWVAQAIVPLALPTWDIEDGVRLITTCLYGVGQPVYVGFRLSPRGNVRVTDNGMAVEVMRSRGLDIPDKECDALVRQALATYRYAPAVLVRDGVIYTSALGARPLAGEVGGAIMLIANASVAVTVWGRSNITKGSFGSNLQ